MNRIKKTIVCLAALLTAGTPSFAQGGKYTIQGKISGADGKTVYLLLGKDKDSTTVKKGKFAFKGQTAVPYQQAALVMGDLNDYNNQRYVQFSLEPAKITIEATADRLQDAIIHGGKTQEEQNALDATYSEANKKLRELNKAYYAAKNAEEASKTREEMEPYIEQITSAQKEFCRTHPDSYLSPQFLRRELGHIGYDELKSVYDSFSDNVRQNGGEDAKAIEKEIETLANVRPGMVAPQFSTTDVNGKPFALADLKGKVVLLDFWASWCQPCRKSNPHVREVYKKYHPKGLEVVYVASDDGAEAKWRKAIDDDQLHGEGYHHVLRGYDRALMGKENPNDISPKYAIHYIPTKYLIDHEGKIVCKVESDEQLDEELQRLLGKPEWTYTVRGKIANADGQKVILATATGDLIRNMVMDTTVVSNGQFEITRNIAAPYANGSIILGDYAPRGNGDNMRQICLEPGVLTIDAPNGSLKEAVITGNPTQDELNQLNRQMADIMAKIEPLNKQVREGKTEKIRNAAREKMAPLSKQYRQTLTDFYKTHPDSYLSPYYLRFDTGNLTYEELKDVYEGFSERVRLYGGTEEIAKELVAKGKSRPGQPAPDFTAKDLNGQDFTLSSLKGKVVILDFWASWCVPCRQSNPHMLELYKKYHDRGLDMVYVSDDDSSPDRWRAAIEKDGLTGDGFHHVLRGLKVDPKDHRNFDRTNDISDKYAVHNLPTKFLIDREGKIVCKIDEGQDSKLDEQLEQLLK